jgi:hypothetical protein
MYDIPLNLQRRFEQRWTARFLSWNWPRPKRTGIKPILAKTKRKTRRAEAAGSRSAPEV